MGTRIEARLRRLEAEHPAKDRDRETLIINRVIVGPRRADEPEVPGPPREVSRGIGHKGQTVIVTHQRTYTPSRRVR